MRKRGRRTPWDPPGGWPLDQVLVGVGTLRTMRELFRRQRGPASDPLRAWDVASRSSVSVQGAAEGLERLERAGLVGIFQPLRPGGADRYRLDVAHPLRTSLARLFEDESRLVPRPRPCASPDRR